MHEAPFLQGFTPQKSRAKILKQYNKLGKNNEITMKIEKYRNKLNNQCDPSIKQTRKSKKRKKNQ